VVAIGSADLADEAMETEAAKSPRDLCGGPSEEASKCLVAEAVNQEFGAEEGQDETEVLGAEEVEAPVGAPVLPDDAGELVQVSVSLRGVIEGGKEFQVATVGGSEDLAQGGQAVDGLLDGGDFHLPGTILVFHTTVVSEEGDVIGRGLDAQSDSELVIHLDRNWPEVMPDATAADAGMEVAPDLMEFVLGELTAQECGHILGPDDVDCAADQGVIEGREILWPLEDHVGRVLALHGAPVVLGREDLEARKEALDPSVEAMVEFSDAQFVGKRLRPTVIGDIKDEIVGLGGERCPPCSAVRKGGCGR